MSSINISQGAPLSTTSTQTTTITIPPGGVSANQINFLFSTPNGNQPNASGDQIYIWQSGNQVPWATAALNSQPVTVNTPQGDGSFTGLNVTNLPYIIGFAVGPTQTIAGWTQYPNVVATAWVPPIGDDNYQYFTPSIKTAYVGTTSLTASYDFLSGFNPQAAGAWVGLWEGTAASYYSPPKWFSAINSTNNTGIASFNNILITRGTNYTLGLFPTGVNVTPANLILSRQCATFTFSS
jgi:hypothetical protein